MMYIYKYPQAVLLTCFKHHFSQDKEGYYSSFSFNVNNGPVLQHDTGFSAAIVYEGDFSINLYQYIYISIYLSLFTINTWV